MPCRPGRVEGTGERVRRVAARASRQGVVRLDLARRFRLGQEALLETRIADTGQRYRNVAIGQAAQIGNAVFGDHDIAQMPRHGDLASGPDNVRARPSARCPRRPQQDDRTAIGKGLTHGCEIILATDATDSAAIVQRVGNGRAAPVDPHRRIDEARTAALQAGQCLLAKQIVDMGDRAHADRGPQARLQITQALIHGPGSQIKPGMQADGIARLVRRAFAACHGGLDLVIVRDRAAQDAPFQEIEHAVREHFAARIKAGFEGIEPADRCGRFALFRPGERIDRGAVGIRRLVAQPDRPTDRVGQGPDPQLQRAAIADKTGGPQTDGVVGQAHAGRRNGEERIAARIQERVEPVGRHRRFVPQEGQVRIDLAQDGHRLARCLAGPQRRHHVQGQVGIAGQAVAVTAGLGRHHLGDHIKPRIQDFATGMGIIGADIIALGIGIAQQPARRQEELLHRDIRGQRSRAPGPGIVKLGIALIKTLRDRTKQAVGQRIGRLGHFQAEGCIDGQVEGRVGTGPAVKGIGQMIGLAERQRQAQHDALADAGNDLGHTGIGIAMARRLRAGVGQWGQGHVMRPDLPGAGAAPDTHPAARAVHFQGHRQPMRHPVPVPCGQPRRHCRSDVRARSHRHRECCGSRHWLRRSRPARCG